MSVIGAVEPTLRKAEVERARRKRPDNLDAYDLFLRALPVRRDRDAGRRRQGAATSWRRRSGWSRTMPPSIGFIAWCHEQRYLRGGLHAETREAACRHAHAAIEAGSDDAMALAMGGFVVGVLERNYETALEALDRSLALSPSSALAFGFSSIIRAWMGDGDRDRACQDRDSPQSLRSADLSALCRSCLCPFLRGEFRRSRQAPRAGRRRPIRGSACRATCTTAALVRLGRLDEAKSHGQGSARAAARLHDQRVGFGNITTPERMGMLAGALRQAGLPE